jgi:hypothetical protein
MGSEGCRLQTASGHGRIIQHGDGSSTYLSQFSAYRYAALGQRIGKSQPGGLELFLFASLATGTG